MFPAIQKRSQGIRHPKSFTFAAIAVVCLALLAFLTVAQVTHTHPVSSDADHCPLCIVMHTAAPAAAAAALITFVQVALAIPAPELRVVTRHWHPQLFTRPPPAIS